MVTVAKVLDIHIHKYFILSNKAQQSIFLSWFLHFLVSPLNVLQKVLKYVPDGMS